MKISLRRVDINWEDMVMENYLLYQSTLAHDEIDLKAFHSYNPALNDTT